MLEAHRKHKALPCTAVESYCGGMFTHAATSGLLAGTGLRQVAERSVAMIAALRLGPQYAVKSISSGLHCTVQFVASHGDRRIRMPTLGPGGPGSPLGPGGPAGPGGPGSPFDA